MKSIKYLLLAAVVMSMHEMIGMQALTQKQQQVTVPTAPAYNPKKTTSKGHVKKGQKAQIQKAVTPYAGYRKLFLILCSPSDEKMSQETLEHLDTGFAEDNPMQTMVMNVAMALFQKAAPILVCNAYVLENIFLMQYGAEAFRNKKDDEDSKEFNEEFNKIVKARKEMQQLASSNKSINESIFNDYAAVFPHQEEEKKGEGQEAFDITEILEVPLDNIAQDFYLYEYHGKPKHTAYLLLPTNGSTSAHDALTKHGFKAAVFKHKDIKALKAELKKSNGSFDYSRYVKAGTDYGYENLDDFSQEALNVVNEALTADDKNPWIIYLNGHGSAYSGKEGEAHSSIAGLALRYFTQGFMPILIDKNTRFCYVLTCSIGGINRDRIRDTFNKMTSLEAVPLIAQEILREKTLKYSNNMITVLGGISDITTMTGCSPPLPTKNFDTFQKAWGRLDKNDPLVNRFLPFVQEVRYDIFFNELIQRLQIEGAKGATTRAALEPWKDVLQYVTPYDVTKDRYIYNDIPQIRFPGHDVPFSVVDIDNRIQVLRYVDVKAHELGGKLAGKGGEPIKIDNKEMVIIYPLSVNVPLEISGTYPSLVSARSDIYDRYFSKIICRGSKNLQNTIHALFTFEAGENIEQERYVLVDELQIKDGIYKDVLIINEATSEEHHSDMGSTRDGSEMDSEAGSQAGTASGFEYFVKTTVYYHTPDNKLMKYEYDHKNKVQEIAIAESDVTDDGHEQAEYATTVEAVKRAVEEERYRPA